MKLPRISTDDNGRHEDSKGAAAMRVLENNYGLNPIETGPLDKHVTLEVTDGRGAPYRLPSRADAPRPEMALATCGAQRSTQRAMMR
jgi:hypothetical protein